MQKGKRTGRVLHPGGICLFWAALILSTIGASAASPSFDCRKARSADEIAICSNPVLADIDALMTKAYQRYSAEFRPKNEVGATYLSDRKKCGPDEACIAAIQARALETYGGGLRWVDLFAEAMMGRKASTFSRAPYTRTQIARVGQCVKTRVRNVTTRFGEPVSYENADQGTSIEYENGDHQVSYGRDEVWDVKAEHTVILCLLSVLHDCPKGDDRGNLYLSLDLDTGSMWTLTDTQHMCGGA